MTSPAQDPAVKAPAFTGYQKFVVAVLAFLQFTIILDFMIISPLGALVMPALSITPQQFGLVVSAYAFSAGASGLLAAGFADRYDRKKLLMFFYTGFILGTLLCGLAQSFEVLLFARIFTGLFGGVIGSIVLAIATDLFPIEMRGRVMGTIQTAFAASQVLGLPAGMYLSTWWDWHAPFIMIVVIGAAVGIIIAVYLKPVNAHLGQPQERSPFAHLVHTVNVPLHLLAFCATALLATGGYMLMPFGSAFTVNNLGIDIAHLPTVYLVTGIAAIAIGPLVGRATDKFGIFPVFLAGTITTIVVVFYYVHMGVSPLLSVILINVALYVGIFARIIPSQILMTAIPEPTKRGAFNAISAAVQQVSGGVAAALAGALVIERADGHLEHFPRLGYAVIVAALITLTLMYKIRNAVPQATAQRQKDLQ
jgi:predicted MFS family arabinose efflux permease